MPNFRHACPFLSASYPPSFLINFSNAIFNGESYARLSIERGTFEIFQGANNNALRWLQKEKEKKAKRKKRRRRKGERKARETTRKAWCMGNDFVSSPSVPHRPSANLRHEFRALERSSRRRPRCLTRAGIKERDKVTRYTLFPRKGA